MVAADRTETSLHCTHESLTHRMSDPELMRSLLTEASSPRRRQFIQRRLATTGERASDDNERRAAP